MSDPVDRDAEDESERPIAGSSPFEVPEEKKLGCISPLGLLAILGSCIVLAAVLAPNFIRSRSGGRMVACKSSLKNLGTAMEMYSSDWSGKYPSTLAQLTPNYLKTLPECSSVSRVTYKLSTGNTAYNSAGFEDYYFLWCDSDNHANIGLSPGYPQYDGIQGLIER